MVPNNMAQRVTLVGEKQGYNLRNNEDFQIHRTKKKSTENTVFNKGLSEFNKMPSELKNEKNLSKFKRLLKDYIEETFEL